MKTAFLSLLLLIFALSSFAQAQEECVICEFLVKTAEATLPTNATVNQTMDFFDEVCKKLLDSSKCVALVNEYGGDLIQEIAKKASPEEACTAVKLCSSQMNKNPTNNNIEDIEIQASDKTCAICEMIVKIFEDLLTQNKTDTDILDAVNEFCLILPEKSVSEQCTDIVMEYGETIIVYLENEFPPVVLCAEVNLCPPAKIPIQFKTKYVKPFMSVISPFNRIV